MASGEGGGASTGFGPVGPSRPSLFSSRWSESSSRLARRVKPCSRAFACSASRLIHSSSPLLEQTRVALERSPGGHSRHSEATSTRSGRRPARDLPANARPARPSRCLARDLPRPQASLLRRRMFVPSSSLGSGGDGQPPRGPPHRPGADTAVSEILSRIVSAREELEVGATGEAVVILRDLEIDLPGLLG
jgi:hypothetical protein